jgi:transcriptional regulator with XRE-family HTH domain
MDAAFDRARLATAVVEERAERGWSQARLAKESGTSVTTVQRLELAAGPRAPYPQRPSTFAGIARAFGWPVELLYAIAEGRTERPHSRKQRLAAPPSPAPAAEEGDFETVLRRMQIGDDLRAVLIDAYRRDKARDDAERRAKYLKIAESAIS